MKFISHEMIKELNISKFECYNWIDYAIKNHNIFINPRKIRIPLLGSDYFNIMPCAIPSNNRMGVKVVTRNENRRKQGNLNIDSKIMLYSYDTCELLAVMDANFITTMRTAAVAVYSMMNIAQEYSTIAMLGLGNIGTTIGDILFELISNKCITVKLYNYKDQAERFAERYQNYKNIHFRYCNNYLDLMIDSDVIISSVTYAHEDFVPAELFKKGCTVIPVHMRGFMECDLYFDHVITSDIESIKNFKYYEKFKKVSLLNDVIYEPSRVRDFKEDRVIVYNLGLALYDILYASNIFDALDKIGDINLSLTPKDYFYV